MQELWLPIAICFLIMLMGAFTQRVSGFGFGITVMTVLPFLFPTFGEATALAGLVGGVSTTYLTVHYRKSIRWRLLLWPTLAFVPLNFLSIQMVAGSDVHLLKAALGIFLVILSIYFLFFSSRLHVKATPGSGLMAGALSGFFGGAFSMGGPPIVVYLLGATGDNKAAYLATIQCFLALTGYASTLGRLLNGLVTKEVLLLFPAALAGMGLGNLIGGRVYQKLNPVMLKKCVYVFMALAGVVIFLTSA